MERRIFSVLAALLLAAGLAGSAVSAAVLLASASPPPPQRVHGEARLVATLHVEPVVLLGNRSTVTAAGAETRVPASVLRNVTVSAVARAAGPGSVGEGRLALYALVDGFQVPVKTGSGRLVFTPSEVLEAAETAARQAGLRPSGRLEALIVYTGVLRAGSVSKPLTASMLVRERNGVVVVTSKPGEADASLPPPPGPARPGWALPGLAAGLASAVAAALVLAYTRAGPPVPGDAVRAESLDERIPVVELRSLEEASRLAEKNEAPAVVVGDRLCAMVGGVAYCAPLRGPAYTEPPAGESRGEAG